MKTHVRKFVDSCMVCQRDKGMTSNVGLHTPLPILSKPWDSMSMDFSLGFPKIKNGFDNICVVVDRFSKMTHFFPCKTTNMPLVLQGCSSRRL